MDDEKENLLINEIKEWLLTKPEITKVNFDDRLKLLYFLRCTKHDLERSKSRIESYNEMRTNRTEWFLNRNPFQPELKEIFDLGVFLPLPKKDEFNRQVVIIRTGVHNPKKHSQNNVFKCSKMILDLLMTLDEDISHSGLVAIFDMTGVSLAHALQLTPTLIKRSVDSWKSYPTKLKLLEFINAPAHVNVVLNTFRLFMSAKMKSRLIVRHSSSKIKTELPVDLGGTGKSYKDLAQEWKQIVENNASFYNQD